MTGKLATLLLLLSFTTVAASQTSGAPEHQHAMAGSDLPAKVGPQKEADIRRLLQATGAGGLALQIMTSMETSARPMLEQSLPPGEYRSQLIDLFLEKFRSKATPDALLTLIIPVYDRHFTDGEIKQLTAFYETPLGKKAVSVLPEVVAESQQAGRAWGEQLGQESMAEVLAEHPDLQKAMEQAQKANH